MNEKYYIGRTKKQIEKINDELELLREERDFIIERIVNLVSLRDLLKEGLKRKK